MIYNRIILLLVVIILAISGCNSPVYYQAESNVANVKEHVDEAMQRSNESGKLPPTLVVNDGPYVDKTPINLEKQPTWLKNHIVLRGDQLPFSFYSRNVVGGAGRNVLTHYQVGLDETEKVSINYSGTVKGALDLLAAKSGYVYTVHCNSVYWQAFVTKTFDIAFMPGSSDYMMGKASGGSSISNVSSGGAGGSSPAAVTAIIDDSASAQYSNLKATLSIWKDLEKTVKQLLSPDGTVMVSESTTSVTVRDRPTNIDLISKYISNMNHNLSKQVLVKVQVLDIILNNAFNYGINWQAVKVSLGQQFQLNANYGTPISLSTLNPFATTSPLGGGTPGLPIIGTDNFRNSSTGVTALINALTQQGKVSLVTEPRVVCLNNQVSVIRIVTQAGYLASVQTTSLSGSQAGGASITTQITPGTVVTGLTLYILPKILGEKVFSASEC